MDLNSLSNTLSDATTAANAGPAQNNAPVAIEKKAQDLAKAEGEAAVKLIEASEAQDAANGVGGQLNLFA